MDEKRKATFGLDENIASALCYVLIWFTGIIFYLVEKDNKMVRFHATQSIVTFIPLHILAFIFTSGFIFSFFWGIALFLSWIIEIIMVICWIVLIIKALQGEKFKLPIVGDIAEKHVG